jgi:hypothetical protein
MFKLKKLIASVVVAASVFVTSQAAFALPDYYEPNNTFDTAYNVPYSTSLGTILSSEADKDYYVLHTGYVGPGAYVDVSIVSPPGGYNYGVSITKYLGSSANKKLLFQDDINGITGYRVYLDSYDSYYFMVANYGSPVTPDANYYLHVSALQY